MPTTYTFAPTTTTFMQSWADPSIWSGGVVPNSTNANVVIPLITLVATGAPQGYEIAVSGSYTIGSLNMAANYLDVSGGSLSVVNNLTVGTDAEIDMNGGTLSAATLLNSGTDIQGSGTITISGVLTNQTMLISDGPLTVSAGSLQNTGSIIASEGPLTLTAGGNGGGVLSDGTYEAFLGGTLDLNIGGPIVTDAATIQLVNATGHGSNTIASFDASTGSFVPIQSSLTTIAPSGTLSILGDTYTATNALTVQGAVNIGVVSTSAVHAPGGTLSTGNLTIAPGGTVTTTGTSAAPAIIAGAVTNNGTITANVYYDNGAPNFSNGYTLIQSAVSGTGSLVVGVGQSFVIGPRVIGHASVTLELGGALAEPVSFADATGTLVLDAPASLSGAIQSYVPGDTIILPGISLSSITNYTYTGTATGGTLAIQEGGSAISLQFAGDYDISSFALSAGPQLLSSSPPSLSIADAPFTGATTATVLQAIANYAANPSINSLSIADDAVDVATHLDALQSIAAAGKLSGISLTDGNSSTLAISQAQLASDAGVLSKITDEFNLAITANSSNATIAGLGSHDTVILPGTSGQYSLSAAGNGTSLTATSTGSIDQLSHVNYLQFSDKTIFVENSDNANIARLYSAAFSRAPDVAGLNSWEDIYANNVSAAVKGQGPYVALAETSGGYGGSLSIAAGFTNSPEFQQRYGSLNNSQFIDLMYENVLGRNPVASETAAWLTWMTTGDPTGQVYSKEMVLVGFAESPENIANTAYGAGHAAGWLLPV